MKTKDLLFLAAFLVGSTLTSLAEYSLSVGAPQSFNSSGQSIDNGTIVPGSAGYSLFAFSFSGGANNEVWHSTTYSGVNYYTLVVDPGVFTSYSINSGLSTLQLGAGKTYLSGSYYTLRVDWSVSDTALSGGNLNFNFAAKTPIGGATSPSNSRIAGSSGAYIDVQPAAVPEPSQVLAGMTIFGCGALFFTGRRWMKKKVA